MEGISTPSFVVNLQKLKKNVNSMIEKTKQLGIELRPHIKTHKTIEGAFYQIFGDDDISLREKRVKSPECKICVSTLGEAKFFAKAGFEDILYAMPVPASKLDKIYELTKSMPKFSFTFDHPVQFEAAEKYWLGI